MKKHLLILSIAMLAMWQNAFAFAYDFSYTYQGKTLYYNIVDGNAQVTYQRTSSPRYTNLSGNLVIPDTVIYGSNTYTVTSIGEYAFDGCYRLTSVTIPNSVTSIGEYAFYRCSRLTSVTIPNSVTTIGYYAFSDCSGLTSVTIPNSVTSIDNSAFSGCTSLTSVTIPNSVTTIGYYAFFDCSSLMSVNYTGTIAQWCNITFWNFSSNPIYYAHSLNINGSPVTNLVIPSGVISIHDNAFYGYSGLTSVTIPNSVTSIGNYAFAECSGLTSVTIPNSVTTISESAFNHVRHIEYYGSATGSPWGAISMNGVIEENFVYSDSTKHYLTGYIGIGGTVTIPSTVDTIGDAVFYGRTSLTSLTIGSGVSSIGDYAFQNCSGLTSVTIPNSIISIGYSAFYDCSGLDTLIVGNGLTTIGSNAFYKDSIKVLSYNCPANLLSYIDKSQLTSVTIGDSITSIGNQSFKNCSGLTSVTIGSSVTSIGNSAFKDCTSLDTVYMMPPTPPSIGTNVFENNASGRVFVLNGCTYNNYYTTRSSNPWYTYRNDIRHPIINFNVYVSTSNSTHGTTAVVLGPGNRIVRCDSTVVVQATANYGYHFDHWSNGNTANPDTITLMGDITVTAYFLPNSYSITGVSNNNARGTVTGSATVDYLDTVTLTATANEHYHLDHWTYTSQNNSGTSTQTDGNTLTLVANKDRSATAYFNPDQYQLTVNTDNSTQGTVSGSGTYDYLSVRTITATANYGYHFDHWSNGSTANPVTITLVGDSTVTAYFLPNRYSITGASANTTRGTVSGSATVDYLDTVVLTANANYGYHIDHWTYTNEDNNNTSTQNGGNTLTLVATRNRTATAYFNPNQYHLTVNTDNSTQGTVSGGGTYDYLTSHTITATANTGYHFDHWSNGSTASSTNITLTSDSTITAYFERNTYNLTVNVNDATLGTVATPDGTSALYRVILTAVATPIEHHHVASWQGEDIVAVSADKDTVWVRMNDNRTVTCNFAIDTHTVNVAPNDPARGMVTQSGTEFAYLSPCTVEATAYTGYIFAGWSNGVTANPYTFAVLEDVELTAIFVSPGEQTYTVTVSVNDPAMGSATVNGNATATVTSGTEVTLQATANSGHRFVRWNDNDTHAVRTVTVTADATYTAYFEALQGIDEIETSRVKIEVSGLAVTVENPDGETVQIYDIAGRQLASSKLSIFNFQFSTSGVYIVKVAGLPARKIVVVK